MRKDRVRIKYKAVKRTGTEVDLYIELEIPEQTVYRIFKGATTKEELMVYALVDILAKLQGYKAGHYDDMEVIE